MEYQVWIYNEYTGYTKKDCGDLPAAQREIMLALKEGNEPLLTVSVPFDVSIKVKEDKIGEAIKGKAKPDKGAGAQSESKAGSGDTEATGAVNK